jgi:hypothetical protein
MQTSTPQNPKSVAGEILHHLPKVLDLTSAGDGAANRAFSVSSEVNFLFSCEHHIP